MRWISLLPVISMDARNITSIIMDINKLSKDAGSKWPVDVTNNIAVVLSKRIKYYAPVRKGDIVKSVRVVRKSKDMVAVEIGAPHTIFVEDGTAPHEIEPKSKKALSYVQDGKVKVKGRVYHPGTTGKKFIERAFNEVSDEVMDIFYGYVDTQLDMYRSFGGIL